MNTSLSLPRLHGAVPARLLPVAGRAERCAIAAFLAKAGMIDAYSVPPDWIAGNDDEIDIALQALENWFRREAPILVAWTQISLSNPCMKLTPKQHQATR